MRDFRHAEFRASVVRDVRNPLNTLYRLCTLGTASYNVVALNSAACFDLGGLVIDGRSVAVHDQRIRVEQDE